MSIFPLFVTLMDLYVYINFFRFYFVVSAAVSPLVGFLYSCIYTCISSCLGFCALPLEYFSLLCFMVNNQQFWNVCEISYSERKSNYCAMLFDFVL